MKVNAARKERAEFKTAACSPERICDFPGAKIVRGEAKNDSSAFHLRKLVFYLGIV